MIRIGAALVLALSAHLFLLHQLRAPTPPVRIAGGAVSFEIGAIAAQGGAGAAEGPGEAEADPTADPEAEVLTEGAQAEHAPTPPSPPLEREPTAPEPTPREVEPVPMLAIDPAPLEAMADTVRDTPTNEDERSDHNPGPKEDVRAQDADTQQADAETVSDDHASNAADSDDVAGGGAQAGASESATEREALSEQAGNAASANYAGEVMRHLSQVRRPRASGPGSAFVSFTIALSGELESLEISDSSGSSRFDRDALRVVERAAPFPAPPVGVNRSFIVEIEGR